MTRPVYADGVGTSPAGPKGDPGDPGADSTVPGPPGYNATGAAEDQETIAAYIAQTAGPNPVSDALLDSFVGTANDDLRWQTIVINGGGLYLGNGDSLEAGTTSSYRSDFEERARAALGDGGPGLQCFNYGVSVDQGAGFGKSDGLLYIDIGDGIYGQHFIQGLYSVGASGADYFGWAPASAWDTMRLLYLKQPGGGTGKIRRDGESEGQAVLINTGTVNPDGTGGAVTTTAIGHFDYANPGMLSAGIQIINITGNTAWFAADFKLSTNPKGYRQGSIARGGAKLQQFAAMNMTSRQQWLAALDPAVVSINLGMNDRLTRTASQFEADLMTLVAATKAGAPDAALLIVQSNEPADHATTYFDDYVPVKVAVARANDCAYYDERTVLGHYDTAAVAGLMEDQIHPSPEGNKRRAQGKIAALGLPVSLADPGRTPHPGDSGGDPTLYGTLARKRGTWAAGGETDVVYRLGLINGYPMSVFSFRAYTSRSGTEATVYREFNMTIANGGTTNNVAYVSPVTTRLVHQSTAGDGQTLDVTMTAVIVAGQLEIRVTAGSFGGTYDVSGDYVFINNSQVGPAVYENAV